MCSTEKMYFTENITIEDKKRGRMLENVQGIRRKEDDELLFFVFLELDVS
jgi:hypothetical protein